MRSYVCALSLCLLASAQDLAVIPLSPADAALIARDSALISDLNNKLAAALDTRHADESRAIKGQSKGMPVCGDGFIDFGSTGFYQCWQLDKSGRYFVSSVTRAPVFSGLTR